MSTIPSTVRTCQSVFASAADVGAFPMGTATAPVGVNPSTLQSLYAQLGGSGVPAEAAGAGRLSSLLGRIPTSLPEAGTFAVEWPGLRAFAGGAAPPLIASQLATAGINNALPSTGNAGDVRQVLGDAATGAGIGAAAGSIVPGVGTGIGAVAGGVAGGAYGLAQDLFGGNEPSKDDTNAQYKATLLTAATATRC
jgi:phage tail tape-measure protein